MPIKSEVDASPSDPIIKMSYADAVGYEFMEVKGPRNPIFFGYADLSMAKLFEELEQPKQFPLKLTSNQRFIVDFWNILNQFPVISKSSKKSPPFPKNILLNIQKKTLKNKAENKRSLLPSFLICLIEKVKTRQPRQLN